MNAARSMMFAYPAACASNRTAQAKGPKPRLDLDASARSRRPWGWSCRSGRRGSATPGRPVRAARAATLVLACTGGGAGRGVPGRIRRSGRPGPRRGRGPGRTGRRGGRSPARCTARSGPGPGAVAPAIGERVLGHAPPSVRKKSQKNPVRTILPSTSSYRHYLGNIISILFLRLAICAIYDKCRDRGRLRAVIGRADVRAGTGTTDEVGGWRSGQGQRPRTDKKAPASAAAESWAVRPDSITVNAMLPRKPTNQLIQVDPV
jgi:hypothetical protein